MEQARRAQLLDRCADLTEAALDLADQAGSSLPAALLDDALTAIRREVLATGTRERDRRR